MIASISSNLFYTRFLYSFFRFHPLSTQFQCFVLSQMSWTLSWIYRHFLSSHTIIVFEFISLIILSLCCFQVSAFSTSHVCLLYYHPVLLPSLGFLSGHVYLSSYHPVLLPSLDFLSCHVCHTTYHASCALLQVSISSHHVCSH